MKRLAWLVSVLAMSGFPNLAPACDPAEPGVLTGPALNPERLLKNFEVSENHSLVDGPSGAEGARSGSGATVVPEKKPEPTTKPKS